MLVFTLLCGSRAKKNKTVGGSGGGGGGTLDDHQGTLRSFRGYYGFIEILGVGKGFWIFPGSGTRTGKFLEKKVRCKVP